jgi:hypothetical protein
VLLPPPLWPIAAASGNASRVAATPTRDDRRMVRWFKAISPIMRVHQQFWQRALFRLWEDASNLPDHIQYDLRCSSAKGEFQGEKT